MFDKIAVVLRGHVRTWHQINKLIFDDYKKIAKTIDYYFVTWDIPGLDENRIIESFKDQNLVTFLKVNTNNYYNGSQGPSWLANCISKYVMDHTYDAIIETRPDVFPFINLDNNFTFNQRLHVIWELPITFNNTHSTGISDTFQIMSTDAFKIYCTRYQKATEVNNHTDLRNFYLENNINLAFFDNMCHPEIVRPTGITFLHSGKTLNDNKKEWWKRWHIWENFSSTAKIHMLSYYNILQEDYPNQIK